MEADTSSPKMFALAVCFWDIVYLKTACLTDDQFSNACFRFQVNFFSRQDFVMIEVVSASVLCT